MAYTPDTIWRNRDQFLQGRDEVEAFLTRKWAVEHGYRLRKELFAFEGDRIAVQFWYEWYSSRSATSASDTDSDSDPDPDPGSGGQGEDQGENPSRVQWWRTYGLEDWTFAPDGLMRKRQTSANDVKIAEHERWFRDGVDVNAVDISERHW
jgi:uncharacterized protein